MASAFAVACGSEEKSDAVTSAAPDAGTEPNFGGKLGKAVQAAESGAPAAKPVGSALQPPATGIFAPGDADKALAPGAQPKIDVVADGSDPRLDLRRKLPTAPEKMPLVVGLKVGPMSLPPMQLDLSVGTEPAKVEKGKDAKKTADAKTPKPATSASAGPVASASEPPGASGTRVYVTITDSKVFGDQSGVPKDAADIVNKLKGSVISFAVTDTGPVGFKRELPEDPNADASLRGLDEVALRAIEQVIGEFFIIAPDKPMGEGGYYMITDRLDSMGVEVVRYRVFTLSKVLGDQAVVSVDQKQYATAPRIDLPELGGQVSKLGIAQYVVQVKGQMVAAPGHFMPTDAALDMQTVAVLPGSNDRTQKIPIDIQAKLGELPTQPPPQDEPPQP